MIDLTITLDMPTKAPEPGAVMTQLPSAAGYARGLWTLVRARMLDGRPVDRFAGYADARARLVSPRYPRQSGGNETRSGAVRYDTSADMHARTRTGSFNVSGGMWSGATVTGHQNAARVVYRGRSEGQDPNFFRYKSGRVKARGKKASNALKAGSVLGVVAVNVLEVAPQEWADLDGAVDVALSHAVEAALPARLVWQGRPMTPSIRRIAALARRGEGPL